MVHDIPNTQSILSSLKDSWWVYQRICQEYCIAWYSKHTPYFVWKIADGYFKWNASVLAQNPTFGSVYSIIITVKWWTWIVVEGFIQRLWSSSMCETRGGVKLSTFPPLQNRVWEDTYAIIYPIRPCILGNSHGLKVIIHSDNPLVE